MSTTHWPLAESEQFDKWADSVIEKSAPRIREIADASMGALRLATYRLLLTLQDLEPRELLDTNKLQARLLAAAAGAGLDPERNSWKEIYTRIVRAGGLYGIETLRGRRAAKRDIAGEMSFDLLNPRVVEWIQSHTLELITLISSDTRAAIQAILLNAFHSGIAPRDQARIIRPLIGLTARQATAVQNYRAALETGNYRATLQNVLRDKRFDARTLRALREGSTLKRAQIDQMVARYAERQLKHRAEMIARTETIRAANAGQIETWNQALDQGLLPSTMRMRWIVAHDERTCPTCPQVPGMNPDGVRIGGRFNTPYGLLDGPPAHPNCRCAVGIK